MQTSRIAHDSVPGEEALAQLKSNIRGELLVPGNAGYEDSRKVWNGLIDKHPTVIARCADANEVVQALQFACRHNLAVAVRGGGHNVAGFGTCDDGLVIDLSPMNKIEVDAQAQTARAQGGLTWGEFDAATQAHGLATTGGLVSTTGVAGFTTGGGIGWLMRKYGLALDNLLAVEVVLADGRRVTASETENADLFWGVRGGGGNFGIVTEFTYRLHPVGPTIFGGALFHPLARAEELLKFYREWARELPDELTTMVAFLTAPPAPFVPAALQGTKMIAIALCDCGALEDGADLVRPLREFAPPAIDLFGPHPYVGLQTMFDASAPRGICAYWKTEYLSGLGDGVIEELVEDAGKMASPLSAIHIHHVQGAVSRVNADATAFGHRDAPFILNILGGWMDPTESDAHIAWVREAWRAVQPYSTGAAYLNFLGDEGQARVQAAYGAQKYERLVDIKSQYDPTNLFRFNQNIKPR
jgi:FAD/FMN-containing dehydrogenase